jgi:hypothetical protein
MSWRLNGLDRVHRITGKDDPIHSPQCSELKLRLGRCYNARFDSSARSLIRFEDSLFVAAALYLKRRSAALRPVIDQLDFRLQPRCLAELFSGKAEVLSTRLALRQRRFAGKATVPNITFLAPTRRTAEESWA